MSKLIQLFDVIVIGGGHAGIESAHAASKMGSNTALISLNLRRIGYMPCNPAIGGIGKGHIVFEISALGGLMPQLCTQTYLQTRMLNTTKGPAVHGLRLQIDKIAYNDLAYKTLLQTKNLTLIEAMVQELLYDEKHLKVLGVILDNGTKLYAKSIVITTGTFLNGLVHTGLKNYTSGRENEPSVTKLPESLHKLNLEIGRLKTGTPPRLLKTSIDFSQLAKQESDQLEYLFEFYPHKTTTKLDCYITHTNEKTHDIIKNNAHLSPIFRKDIVGKGPRYCPSIEDKVVRFSEKTSHQIFIEPESMSSDWIYPNGISTSLPLAIQQEFIHSIKGFENAIITRAGYAIEYDFILPHQLKETLELKKCDGLFFAGQINGTTGYEEAAGQGIVAGINAHLHAHNLPPFILDRSGSYIGVMINDLTTLSVDEPYRMFTSRAERRLLLRQDNAFLRLTEKAYLLGLINNDLYNDFLAEKLLIQSTINTLHQKYKPTELLNIFKENHNPHITLANILDIQINPRACQTIQAMIKYGPYIEREELEVLKLKKHQQLLLPDAFSYKTMQGLSIELREKLEHIKPKTIADASIIPGMTPAALSCLILHITLLQKHNRAITI